MVKYKCTLLVSLVLLVSGCGNDDSSIISGGDDSSIISGGDDSSIIGGGDDSSIIGGGDDSSIIGGGDDSSSSGDSIPVMNEHLEQSSSMVNLVSEDYVEKAPKIDFSIKGNEEKLAPRNIEIGAEEHIKFLFNDIVLTKNDKSILIENYTPFLLDDFYAKINENIYYIKLDKVLSGYSKAEYSTNIDILSITPLFGDTMFQPVIIWGNEGDEVDSSKCLPVDSDRCYAWPTEEQQKIYERILVNMHNSFNSKYFLPLLKESYDQFCADGKYGCAAHGNKAHDNYLRMAIKGHQLKFSVLYHESDHVLGVGGNWANSGLDPMYTSEAISRGWASIWFGTISKDNDKFAPNSYDIYKTMFHEPAHGYNFDHESGMTYGFSEIYGRDFKNLHIPVSDVENISAKKTPDVILSKIGNQNGIISYEVLSKPDVDVFDINITVLNTQAISYEDRLYEYNGKVFYDIKFLKTPQTLTYIQLSSSNYDYMYTERLETAEIYPEDPVLVTPSGKQYYDLSIERINKDFEVKEAKYICPEQIKGSRASKKSDSNELWDLYIKDTENTLKTSEYIGAEKWSDDTADVIDFSNHDSFVRNKISRSVKFNNDYGLICIKD
ncbi:TPA: hypothetical protein ACX6SY_002056 [Photobacterium damselae]